DFRSDGVTLSRDLKDLVVAMHPRGNAGEPEHSLVARYDAESGTRVGEVFRVAGSVVTAELSGDRSRILVATRDGKVRTLDGRTGRPLLTLSVPRPGPAAPAAAKSVRPSTTQPA